MGTTQITPAVRDQVDLAKACNSAWFTKPMILKTEAWNKIFEAVRELKRQEIELPLCSKLAVTARRLQDLSEGGDFDAYAKMLWPVHGAATTSCRGATAAWDLDFISFAGLLPAVGPEDSGEESEQGRTAWSTAVFNNYVFSLADGIDNDHKESRMYEICCCIGCQGGVVPCGPRLAREADLSDVPGRAANCQGNMPPLGHGTGQLQQLRQRRLVSCPGPSRREEDAHDWGGQGSWMTSFPVRRTSTG